MTLQKPARAQCPPRSPVAASSRCAVSQQGVMELPSYGIPQPSQPPPAYESPEASLFPNYRPDKQHPDASGELAAMEEGRGAALPPPRPAARPVVAARANTNVYGKKRAAGLFILLTLVGMTFFWIWYYTKAHPFSKGGLSEEDGDQDEDW